MASELVRKLIDSGIHFGHRASRWNPKMRPYIFTKRNSIHIIDIRETVKGLLHAKKFLAKVVSEGHEVLFVGTKRQARDAVRAHAGSVEMPYVCERWLGGTLTNFRTIRSRLGRLEELELAEADGSAAEYSKKQISRNARELRKISRSLSGIRKMSRLPKALVIIDVQREKIAVREAKALGIPTVCLIDTDSDPDFADIPIPGNDDAMRSINLVLELLAGAVTEGIRARPAVTAARADSTRKRSARAPLARADGGDGDDRPEDSPVQAVAPVSDVQSDDVATQTVPETSP